MEHSFNRKIRIVSALLIAALLAGFLPWRELSADSATHGEYTSSPFTVTYEQNSTWGNSTQGQFEVTNTSAYDITSWSLEIDYLYDVSLTNIWNVSGAVTDGNVIVSSNSNNDFVFHFTNQSGAEGIINSGEIYGTKIGFGGSGVYAGTTPTPSWALKHIPGYGWGLGEAPIRIPIAIDSVTSIRTLALPAKTVVVSNTSYNSIVFNT